MADHLNTFTAADAELDVAAIQNRFVNRVFGWMTAGLAITGVIAYLVSCNVAALLKIQQLYLLLVLLELGVVVGLSAAIRKLSPAAAALGFVFFAALNGLTLSWIFLAFDSGAIATTFFATSGAFGLMGLFGWMTRRDLTGLGSLCMMGLFGIIIASVLTMFFPSTGATLVINVVGVLIFVGLIAYDTQKIKQLALVMGDGEIADGAARKVAILGALELYLDFINLFLMLLRLFGNRK